MHTPKNILYNFDNFTVEVDEGRLWRGQEQVALTRKAFETLLVLLKYKGKIVNKDVLLSEVWHDTFVEEVTLAKNISTLRKALGTLPNGNQFIETVPRKGYRFLADVKEIVGDEEVVIVEHRSRTEISSKEDVSEEIISQPGTDGVEEQSAKLKSFISQIKRHRFLPAILLSVFCLILVGISLAARYYLQNDRFSISRFGQIEIKRLTSNGNISLVSASPDGHYLALVKKQNVGYSLELRQIDDSTTIEIVPPKKQRFLGVTFSADGKRIFYVTFDNEFPEQDDQIGKLFEVSVLGGPVQQIAAGVDSSITVSPDGKKFAFVRNSVKENQSAIIIASFDGKEERELASRSRAEYFSSANLAWSPDGKIIAAASYTAEGKMMLSGINAEDGAQKSLFAGEWTWIGSPNWLADGSGLIVPAFRNQSGSQTDEIWEISFPEGATRKIADGINGILGLSLTGDSNSIVAVKSEIISNFWVSGSNDFSQAVRIRQNLPEYNIAVPGIDWTPDGKILYGSTINGNLDIWMIDEDNTYIKQLTTDEAADSMPVSSPDGQYIVFVSNRSGKRNIWQMKIDGSEQKQLTNEENAGAPSLSADGENVFYTSPDKFNQPAALHRISINGGTSVQLTSAPTFLPQVSPDGKLIVCYYAQGSDRINYANNLKLTVLSAETGNVVRQFDAPVPNPLAPVIWSDSRHINYLANNRNGSELWQQSLDDNNPVLILKSTDEKILRFSWTRDNKKLIYEKGSTVNDVILIKSV